MNADECRRLADELPLGTTLTIEEWDDLVYALRIAADAQEQLEAESKRWEARAWRGIIQCLRDAKAHQTV